MSVNRSLVHAEFFATEPRVASSGSASCVAGTGSGELALFCRLLGQCKAYVRLVLKFVGPTGRLSEA